jgi:hypothetical protein
VHWPSHPKTKRRRKTTTMRKQRKWTTKLPITLPRRAAIDRRVGVGIAAFASLSHRLFGGESLKVWIIETANDALNLTIAGAIITFFN